MGRALHLREQKGNVSTAKPGKLPIRVSVDNSLRLTGTMVATVHVGYTFLLVLT